MPFVRNISITAKDRDDVERTVICAPLTRKQALLLFDATADVKDDESLGKALSGHEIGNLMAQVIKTIEPTVQDADGEVVPIEDICGHAYFTPFIGAVAMRLVNESFVKNDSRPIN